MLASLFVPNHAIGRGREDLIMDATWEDGTVNSGDPEINAEPPLEERLFVDPDIARNSDFSLAHQGLVQKFSLKIGLSFLFYNVMFLGKYSFFSIFLMSLFELKLNFYYWI